MLSDWLEQTWPRLIGFLLSPVTLLGLTLFSLATFLCSVAAASWAVKRLPVDFLLVEPERFRLKLTLGLVLRNLLGLVLFVLGALMLVLPGQGLLTMLAALALMDFPGKRRLERRLMLVPSVLRAINRLRLRAGHPRLLAPGPDHSQH